MTDKKHREDKIGRLAEVVARTRYDPERLAAVKRAMTGKTRCPECDEINPADQKRCDSCGARLYPEVREKKKEELEDHT